MTRRPITAEDLLRFKLVSDPQIAPDGTRVAWIVRTIEGRKYPSHLWVDDSAWTRGPAADRLPRWSPDGRTIAFVRSAENEESQIWTIAGGGGEAVPLTKLPAGKIKEIVWSPDGTRIAFVFHPGAREKEPPVARHITRLRYKEEGTGFVDAERDHIWIAEARDGTVRQLTRGDWDDGGPAWSPDSRRIAFVSNRHRDPDRHLLEIDLWVVRAAGGEPRRLPKPKGPAACPSWSPDGRTIAFLGHDKPEDSWGTANTHVWSVPADGSRQARDLVRRFDRTCEDMVINDMKSFHGTGQRPIWSEDGRSLFFIASDRGGCHLFRTRARGGEPEALTRGRFEVMGFTMAGGRFAVAAGDAGTIGEVYRLDPAARIRPVARLGDLERVSHANDALFRERILAKPESFDYRSADGTRIQGWLLKPPGVSPRKKRPVILQIHGGPRAQYGHAFFHEFQVLAAAGYAVLYANPRGSQGYGESFARAIVNDWGNLDYRDLMTGVDEVVKEKWVDTRRLGVCGGSYGGYMTNWVVGHTNRFRAAITMRSVTNLFSFYGTSDMGYDDVHEFGGHAFDDPGNYARQSPITFVKKIRTPLLILHSEGDLRCPIEQAEQMYTMLKAMKREVELVRFPEENHDLSRIGRPDRRLERLRHILRWWKRYLG